MAQTASPLPTGDGHHQSVGQLGPLLCWAVVFADIGSSIYYVPGILYGRVGSLAGFFVLLTMSVFVLLTLKYAEVSEKRHEPVSIPISLTITMDIASTRAAVGSRATPLPTICLPRPSPTGIRPRQMHRGEE